MELHNFLYTIEIVSAVGLLLWFFTNPWQSFCTDITRQRIFELRDQLFFLAVNGRISFDDPLYCALRGWLNNRIRLAHTNRIGDLVAILVIHKGAIPNVPTLSDELGKIEDEVLRKEMRDIYFQAIRVQIDHMVVRSPIILAFTVLTPFIILVEMISGGVRVCMQWITDLAQVVDDEARKQQPHMMEPN